MATEKETRSAIREAAWTIIRANERPVRALLDYCNMHRPKDEDGAAELVAMFAMLSAEERDAIVAELAQEKARRDAWHARHGGADAC